MDHMKKRPNNGTQSRQFLKKIPGYLFFLACGVLFCWLFLCICAKIMCMTDFSQNRQMVFAEFSSLAAVLLASLLYTRRSKTGLLAGAALAVGGWTVLCIIGTVMRNSFTGFSLLRIFSFLCAGMLGSLLGMTHGRPRMRKHR